MRTRGIFLCKDTSEFTAGVLLQDGVGLETAPAFVVWGKDPISDRLGVDEVRLDWCTKRAAFEPDKCSANPNQRHREVKL